MKKNISRKDFIKYVSLLSGTTLVSGLACSENKINSDHNMKLGLVTYLWGKEWDIPTIIENCKKTGILGVELRINHAHGVDIDMSISERALVRKQFTDGGVEILGMGTNQKFDYPDQDELKKSIEVAKEYVMLSNDIGGSGIKVKPNGFHEGIPHEKTIDQIGKSLNELAKFAKNYDQEIRLEVHGKGTQQLPVIKQIMDVANHPNATVCWNCNNEDLDGKGLKHNFNLVKNRFGNTVHVRELNSENYPYQELMNMFKKINYAGWILLECRTDPADKVKALEEQKAIWKKML